MQLGKVTIQWLFIATLDQDLISVTKHQRAKPLPLRFENPVSLGWQFSDSFGQHRQQRRIYGKIHRFMVYRALSSRKSSAGAVCGSWLAGKDKKISVIPALTGIMSTELLSKRE